MVKKKKNQLNKFERDILRLISQKVSPLSVNKIAEELEISYNTARKYLKTLLEKNLILKV